MSHVTYEGHFMISLNTFQTYCCFKVFKKCSEPFFNTLAVMNVFILSKAHITQWVKLKAFCHSAAFHGRSLSCYSQRGKNQRHSQAPSTPWTATSSPMGTRRIIARPSWCEEDGSLK